MNKSMPGVAAIVRYWAEQGTFRRVESDEDRNCFACGEAARCWSAAT